MDLTSVDKSKHKFMVQSMYASSDFAPENLDQLVGNLSLPVTLSLPLSLSPSHSLSPPLPLSLSLSPPLTLSLPLSLPLPLLHPQSHVSRAYIDILE